MQISNRIKEWREKRGLSVKDVSSELGIPESTYRGYEYGSKLPAELVPNLCRLFNVNFKTFFSDPNYKNDLSKDIWNELDTMERCLKSIQDYIKRTKLKN